jgi:hypothetical protein
MAPSGTRAATYVRVSRIDMMVVVARLDRFGRSLPSVPYRRVRSALDEVRGLESWPPSVAALGRALTPPGPANG